MGISTRQPGIYFHTASPTAVSDLPRMDVAGFVGFASNGPLHTPVLVEDMSYFRDVFGDDIALAWDPQLKCMQYSLLGSTVESFFRNGGQRCWVVRVAADGASGAQVLAASQARFSIPGLYRADNLLMPDIYARSPGSWAKNLSLSTRLNSQSLAVNNAVDSSSPYTGVLRKIRGQYLLRLRYAPGQLQAGDLLELRCGSDGLRAYLFVQDQLADESGIQITARDVYWFAAAESFFPHFSVDKEPSVPVPLGEAEALALYDDYILSHPEQVPVVRWLLFDLLVWRGDALYSQLNGLGFHPLHDRFWGFLPNDRQLFGELIYSNPVSLQPAIIKLLEDIINPRFALASKLTDINAKDVFLPLTMSALPSAVQIAKYGDTTTQIPDYILDGLGIFNADLFLDEDMAALQLSSLLSEANYQRFVKGRSLKGIYSLLALDEISMVAVPDMLHRHWDMTPPDFAPLLQAPQLNAISDVDEYGLRWLSWIPPSNVRRFIVQQSLSSDFDEFVERQIERPSPLELESDHEWPIAPDAELQLSFAEDCTQYYFYRVRAEAYGQFSPWSNCRVLRQPASSFYECENPDPALLGLRLRHQLGTSTVDVIVFNWEPEDELSLAFNLTESFQLQRATDMDFVSAVTVYPLDQESPNLHQIERLLLTDTVSYYRIRAISGDVLGPWSNTIEINPTRLSVLTLNEVSEYVDQDLQAVQFALIRLCAVKADALAILCLPAHYQDDQVLAAADDLLPRSLASMSSMSVYGSGVYSVPGLNISEQTALSYAALYSPWLRISTKNTPSAAGGNDLIKLIPPVGAVCGKLAATAIQRGAWIASENKALQDVLGVGYRSIEQISNQLADKQINLIYESPRGFIVARGNTLSRSKELRALNVRRLLILLRRMALREGDIYVFESNGDDFRNRVHHYWESLLNSLYQRGALQGNSPATAYRVITDESVNDERNQELGRFVVELQVSPSQAMNFIHIKLIQNGSDQLLFQEL